MSGTDGARQGERSPSEANPRKSGLVGTHRVRPRSGGEIGTRHAGPVAKALVGRHRACTGDEGEAGSHQAGPRDGGRLGTHRARAGERGVAGVLAAAAVVALVTVAAVGVLAMTYAAAARSVRAAADLVAISGAQAEASGADACLEARRIASRNDVELSGCEVAGDPIDYVVAVDVRRSVGWQLPGLPDRVTATAYAGNVTGVP